MNDAVEVKASTSPLFGFFSTSSFFFESFPCLLLASISSKLGNFFSFRYIAQYAVGHFRAFK